LEKAVLADPANAEAHLFLGQSQLELGDLAAAERTLRRAVSLTVADSERAFQSRRIRYLLGRLLAMTGRKEEAEKELAIARKLQEQLVTTTRDGLDRSLSGVAEKVKPDDGGTASKLPGHTYGLEPSQLAALSKLRSFLGETVAQAFHNLGVVEAQNGNLQESISRFEAAARLMPNLAGLDRNWGIVAFRASEFDKAVGPLTRHLAASPKDDLVRQMLGTVHYFSKSFKQAVETLKPLEPTMISKPELAYFYGIALVQLQRNTEAIPVFDRLAAASQKDAEALFYAGQGFMILGDYDRAVKEFTTAAALAPSMPKTHSFIGQSLIRLNRFGDAERSFRQALVIEPADETSRYHLAFTLIERKTNLDEAVSLLNEALQLRPDYADAHYQLGKIYNERGEIDKAIEHLEAATRADKTKDYVFYQLSIAYRKVSRKSDADQALKTYQDLKSANRQLSSPMGNTTNAPNQ
jgi:tetratricopeptide (TPR) repeat protein